MGSVLWTTTSADTSFQVHHEEEKAFIIDENYNVERKVDMTDGDHEKANGTVVKTMTCAVDELTLGVKGMNSLS